MSEERRDREHYLDVCRICGLSCCPCDHIDDVPMFDLERPPRHLRSVKNDETDHPDSREGRRP